MTLYISAAGIDSFSELGELVKVAELSFTNIISSCQDITGRHDLVLAEATMNGAPVEARSFRYLLMSIVNCPYMSFPVDGN